MHASPSRALQARTIGIPGRAPRSAVARGVNAPSSSTTSSPSTSSMTPASPSNAPQLPREPPSLQGKDAEQLRKGIANFYDESSGLWEDVWGEHMHHGYWPDGGRRGRGTKTNAEAQVDLIDAVLAFAGVSPSSPNIKSMVDVGCGIGGSSRHIISKKGFEDMTAVGITLSPKQASRANELAAEQGLSSRASFRVADALEQPFDDGSFDIVWSLESGEHMPDKRRFVNELARVASRGGKGTVVVATWVHRDLSPGEKDLTEKEKKLLSKINRAYYLPPWCSGADYEALFEAAGLVDVKREDWSADVAPFWGDVIRSALTVRGVVGLLRAGWGTIKGALAMPLMSRGFKKGLIKFVVIAGTTKR